MVKAYFDGSAKPNPGQMKIGGYFRNQFEETVSYSLKIGYGTNNEAEYNSLLYLVKLMVKHKVMDVEIKGDSLLVVNQVNGTWKSKNQNLKKLKEEILTELKQIPKWSLTQIPREENQKADALT
jgi:ribonuclease HI